MAAFYSSPYDDENRYEEFVHSNRSEVPTCSRNDEKKDLLYRDTIFKWGSVMITIIVVCVIVLIGLQSVYKKDNSCDRMICLEGWHRYDKSCYLFITKFHRSWRGAQDYCMGIGSSLTEVASADENRFITSNLVRDAGHEDTDHDYWVGGTDVGHEGKWKWKPTNMFLTWTNWAYNAGQWHNNTEENCLVIIVRSKQVGYWNDDRCDKKLHFVCERRIS